jgi:hypothetical protein
MTFRIRQGNSRLYDKLSVEDWEMFVKQDPADGYKHITYIPVHRGLVSVPTIM